MGDLRKEEPRNCELQEEEERTDDFNEGKEINKSTTIMGIVTGMVEVNCLVLPTMGLSAGYITSIWTCILVAFICYYTARLLIIHMGKYSDVKESILDHFQDDYKYMKIYTVINWLALVPGLFAVFRILCLQIEGLLGYSSVWVGPSVAVFLIGTIIVIRSWHFAE
jgi:hypothetical protein